MSIKLQNNKNMRRCMLGNTRVRRIMLGSQRIYSETAIYDDFVTDGYLDDVGSWESKGLATTHRCSVENGRMRIHMSDKLVVVPGQISYMRNTAGTLTSDSGYVETQVATTGDSIKGFIGETHFVTQVFGRFSNSGANDGAGIHLAASRFGLVSRKNMGETVIEWFGTYSPGDVIRMQFNQNNYTFFKNGESCGSITTNEIVYDSNHRSLAVRADGAKETLGPRRYSPALEWVEMGEIT